MYDQAKELRQLVRRDALDVGPERSRAPKLTVVMGGKGGVGTTTVALNLAVALQQGGRRCVLVDANLAGADAAIMCRLDPDHSLAHLVSRRRAISDILLDGPGGIQVLPGPRADEPLHEFTAQAQRRMLAELASLRPAVDQVVLDAGGALSSVSKTACRIADTILIVTTPDDVAIRDSYAAIKWLNDQAPIPAPWVVVNQCEHLAQPKEVRDRLARVCRRFLGLTIRQAAGLPRFRQPQPSDDRAQLAVLGEPGSVFAENMNQLARWLSLESEETASAPTRSPERSRIET